MKREYQRKREHTSELAMCYRRPRHVGSLIKGWKVWNTKSVMLGLTRACIWVLGGHMLHMTHLVETFFHGQGVNFHSFRRCSIGFQRAFPLPLSPIMFI